MCTGAIVYKLRGVTEAEMEYRVSSVKELFSYVDIIGYSFSELIHPIFRIAEDIRDFHQRRSRHSWIRQGWNKSADKEQISGFKLGLDRILQRFGVRLMRITVVMN
jgi:hypothetical protein